jgi:ABC-type polysaccharide/polyol phosphate transport system ATPase subunit
MMLRLILAVATAVEGEIVLLDEWIGVGDQQFRRKARHRLDEIVACAGIVVLASHDIGVIQSTCNRAILLEQGQVTAAGMTHEVLGRYLGGGTKV